MNRLTFGLLLAACLAAPALGFDNASPGLSSLQVTDCNNTPQSLTTNIQNPNILLRIQDSQSGLHVGNAPLIAGSSTPSNTNLFWTFNTAATTIADDSLNNETGLLQCGAAGVCPSPTANDPRIDGVNLVTGVYGLSLHFLTDQPATTTNIFGVTRHPAISTASLDNLFNAITVEAWVKLGVTNVALPFVEFSTTTRPSPADELKGPFVRFNTHDGTTANLAGGVYADFVSSGAATPGVFHHVLPTETGPLADGAYHLVTVTWSNPVGSIIVDGVLVSSKDFAGNFPLRTDSAFRVGYSTGNAASPALAHSFVGSIDQLRVLSRAEATSEALQVFDGGRVVMTRNGVPGSTLYRVAVGGDYADGDTGLINFSRSVSALTGGNLSIGANTVAFQVSDRAGNSSALSGTITYQPTAPGAPQITAMTAQGVGGITYTWSRPGGVCTGTAPSYRIYKCDDTLAGVPNVTDTGTTNTNSEVPANAPPNANIKVGRKVSAIDNVLAIEGPKSPCAQTYTFAKQPVSLTTVLGSVTTGSMTLTWGTNANPAYTRYELLQYTDATRNAATATKLVSLQDNFTGNVVPVGGLSPGTTYSFSVFSYNGDGADLDTPGGRPNAVTADADLPTLVAASTITARAASATTINWDWQAVQGADSYRVVNATSPATIICQGTSAALCTTPGPPLQCACAGTGPWPPDTGVSAYVQAGGPAGFGVPSNTASAFTLALAPSNFQAPAAFVTSNTVTLTWNQNGNNPNTLYEIQRSTSAAIFGVISTASAQGTSAVIVGLLPASTYFFQLRARNGDERFSAPAPQIPQAVTLPAPGITSSSGPPTAYDAPAGALAIWHFDEGSGALTFDGSGRGHHGTPTCDFAGCTSTPTFTAGPPGLGTALNFVGQGNSYVFVSTSAAFNAPAALTLEAWVNPSTAFQTPEATIIAKGSSTDFGYALDVDNGSGLQRWRLRVGNGAGGNACGVAVECLVAPTTLDPGKWHQLIAVWDPGSNSQQMYVDGTVVATRTLTAAGLRNLTTRVTIGNRPFGGTATYNAPFAGMIDEVRVLNRAVTAAEAAVDFAGGQSGAFAPPPPNDQIRLTIPPNAFGAPVRIFVSNDPRNNPLKAAPAAVATGLAQPPTGFSLVPGSLVEIVAQVNGAPFTDPLGSSVTVSLPYADADNNGLIDGTSPPLDARQLAVYTLKETPPQWERLTNAAVDLANHRVSGATGHFSVFALFGTTGIGSGPERHVFPVPWKPGSGGKFDSAPNCNGGIGLCFTNLAQQGTIRIFTFAGEMVVELSYGAVNAGSFAWDGRNASGQQVASGVYFARITGFSTGSRIEKFAIER